MITQTFTTLFRVTGTLEELKVYKVSIYYVEILKNVIFAGIYNTALKILLLLFLMLCTAWGFLFYCGESIALLQCLLKSYLWQQYSSKLPLKDCPDIQIEINLSRNDQIVVYMWVFAETGPETMNQPDVILDAVWKKRMWVTAGSFPWEERVD